MRPRPGTMAMSGFMIKGICSTSTQTVTQKRPSTQPCDVLLQVVQHKRARRQDNGKKMTSIPVTIFLEPWSNEDNQNDPNGSAPDSPYTKDRCASVRNAIAGNA